ncbi:unnamed protein product [Spirodela intermedia]|uniref:Uncharacterized protein n=1 Tax=Spirodela intermedia TaxID=51605 RepID=A0A7I8IMF9_SPIIN|nr:unnamed protein product [Spirodela intermedia]CAA6658730.1 unnamed protein product [Spirodela intermedia]
MGVDINSKPQTTTVVVPTQSAPECKCGMPLCICTTALADPVPEVAVMQENIFFNMGQQAISRVDQDHGKYEVNGDGLREAIKYSDGVDPNYRDKQGCHCFIWYALIFGFFSYKNCAALFNQTEIAFILMDHGASLESKNAQGETPLDCAPTMLQYKMRQKMERGLEKVSVLNLKILPCLITPG